MAGSVTLQMHPKVDRGFFLAPEDSEWTCYRRNYFQLSLAYSITSQNPSLSNEGLLAAGIMLDYHGRQERVTGFKLTIGARVYNSDQKIIDLVQHTPKRDKGPQLKPALNLMTPGGDVERHAHHDSADTDEERAALSGNIPEGEAPRVVTYERIQFKQATANNGKRRAAQQYFSLIVEAYAVVLGAQGPEDIRVAVAKSSPVVVRGRSPGHYSDNPPSEQKRPQELTTSTSFLRNEQPSPTSIKSTPTLPVQQHQRNTPPSSIPQSTPVQTQDTDIQQSSQPNLAYDRDFLDSLEADFNGYQYLPFTLLDPQGKIVVPHDLFYDPHEFPDTHYANLLFNDPNMTLPNDPVATTNFATNNSTSNNIADGEFPNLYQGFFDFPAQSDPSWNLMARAPSAQSSSQVVQSPFPKDRISNSQPQMENNNWFETFQNNSQVLQTPFRPNSNPPSSQAFNLGFGQDSQNVSGNGNGNGNGNGSGSGNGNGNGGKWMFEFRNSSYGYFPNLPAMGDMHSS